MIFADTITIYNHYKVNRVDHWGRTIISGVQWSKQTTKTVSSDGKLQVADSVSITIPYGAPKAEYVTPKIWEALNDKTGYWTLGTDNLDIIALGELNIEIGGQVTITSIKKDYDNVVTVQTVNDNTGRAKLKTWKVVAD